MKLIIYIPCYNEAATLALTLSEIPRAIPDVDVIELMVVDDGSTDETARIANSSGVHHIVSHKRNLGLAAAFRTALDSCLNLGADVIVGTDADNQYAASDIPALVAPLLSGDADVVVGCRDINAIPHFSIIKKTLQNVGSGVVRMLSGLDVRDAPSGFRAYNREAAMRLVVLSNFSYTLESLIEAGYKGLKVKSVPVRVNPPTRPSRLFTSLPQYIRRSVATLLRAYILFKPLRVLGITAAVVAAVGLALVARFFYFYLTVSGPTGHIQSLVIGAVIVLLGFQAFIVALLADLIAANRRLLEDILYRVKMQQYERR